MVAAPGPTARARARPSFLARRGRREDGRRAPAAHRLWHPVAGILHVPWSLAWPTVPRALVAGARLCVLVCWCACVSLRTLLVDKEITVRTLAFRALRYFITEPAVLRDMLALNMD